ncbi:MAG TPA: esterase-like activity of phytase family protein [Alphaproteobacteria bacterium]
MARPRGRAARLLVALAALLAAPWPAPAARAESIEVSAQPLQLDPYRPDMLRVGRLEYRGGLALVSPDKRFGGFSALHVSRDGTELLALSDQGYWLKMQPTYDERGRLVGIADASLGPLLGLDGWPLVRTDIEAMTELPGGQFLVAFEDNHRLWLYPRGSAPFDRAPTEFREPPGLKGAPRNGGIEALTRLNDGRILAIAEKLPAAGAEGAVANAAWVGGAPGWRRLSYQRTGAYLPTAATTLPPATRWEGDVVVTERSFNIIDGFSIRVVLVPFDDIRPGRRLVGTEIARFDRPLTFEGIEGVAARRGPNGETLLYFMTDDNFSPVQKTLLQMFELKE